MITDKTRAEWRTGLHAANPEQARELQLQIDGLIQQRKHWIGAIEKLRDESDDSSTYEAGARWALQWVLDILS